MRAKDEVKKEKIRAAVLQIVAESGISALSFEKIASRACVSSATPYVYYKDKKDMLSQIYIEVKNLLDRGLKESISKGETIEEQLFGGVFHFALKYYEYPLESSYAYTISNAPQYLTEEARAESLFLTKPLLDLYDKARREKALKTDGQDELNALLFAPMAAMLMQSRGKEDLARVEEVVRLSVESVMK